MADNQQTRCPSLSAHPVSIPQMSPLALLPTHPLIQVSALHVQMYTSMLGETSPTSTAAPVGEKILDSAAFFGADQQLHAGSVIWCAIQFLAGIPQCP